MASDLPIGATTKPGAGLQHLSLGLPMMMRLKPGWFQIRVARLLLVAVLFGDMTGGCTVPAPEVECGLYTDLTPALSVRRRGNRLEAQLYTTGAIESMTGGWWSYSEDEQYNIVIRDFEHEVTIVIFASCEGQDGLLEGRYEGTFDPPEDGAGWIYVNFVRRD